MGIEKFIDKTGEYIEKSYYSFIIRDILSFVLPGLVFLASFAFLLYGYDICINGIKYWLLILLVSYPIGVSLQFLGRCLMIVKECKNNDKPSYFKSEMDFLKSIAKSKDRYNDLLQKNPLYRERLIGIRQMSGNLLTAIVFSGILIGLGYWMKYANVLYYEVFMSVIYIIIISIGLLFAQKSIIEDLDIWQDSRIKNV